MQASSTYNHGFFNIDENASINRNDATERHRRLSHRSATAPALHHDTRDTSPSPGLTRPKSTAIPQSLVPGGRLQRATLNAKPSHLFFESHDNRDRPHRHSTGVPMIHAYSFPAAYPQPEQSSSSAPLNAMPIPTPHTPSLYPPCSSYAGTSTQSLPSHPSPPSPYGPRTSRPQSGPQPAVSFPQPQVPSVAETAEENTYEDDALAMALVLSAQSASEQSRQAAEEEEELARALAESARMADERKRTSYFPDVHPDDWGEAEGSTSRPKSMPNGDTTGSSVSTDPEQQLRDDEALARRLQMEAEQEARSAQRESQPQQIHIDDEAFARQLVAEEEAQAALKDQESRPPLEARLSSDANDLPAYSRAPPSAPGFSRPQTFHEAGYLGRSQSAGVVSTTHADLPLLYPHAVRSMSVGPLLPNSATAAFAAGSPSPESPAALPVPDPMASPTPTGRSGSPSRHSYLSTGSALASLEEEDGVAANQFEPSLASALQFVEPELLLGVSMGFHAPSITPELSPMQEAPQGVITLPYGKAPPYHIQAPTWRHLLKLLVRMRTGRIEASIEAMALKQDLKLRTVVQFVRVHHRSTEWRTILYLSLDYPVPQAQASGWKYVNGDVNTLPYSYTLSSLPALLRDGADSPMAKSYTIPLTPNTPFPALPITLPNMALYLQSSLEESRKALHDSSSGMRKLAQLVNSCYPEDVPVYEESDLPERKGVRYRLRRVFGKKENRERGGGNEDVYELITPFVPDEQDL